METPSLLELEPERPVVDDPEVEAVLAEPDPPDVEPRLLPDVVPLLDVLPDVVPRLLPDVVLRLDVLPEPDPPEEA
ncbi:MAG: hypothetical protein AB8H79_01445 [Myxococcota bacterium]